MPDAASDLYALPLEEFVAGRDALAKELRAAGDRDGAAAVKALRKPTPAAWVVNQLARDGRLEEVLEAAAGLRAAQEAALGGDASGLRDATSDERSAVDRALAQARELRPGGRSLSGATAEKVRDLLHAVARDEEVADAVREGRVTAEPQEIGAWGLGTVPEAAPAARARRAPAREKRAPRAGSGGKSREPAPADGASRDREAAERRKAEQARRRELRDAQEERTRLRRAAERAARRLSEASEAVERARAALESAEEAADEAQAAFDEARGAAAEAEARISELE